MSKIWIIAGEASGDSYGAELARQLRIRQPEVSLQGMGSSLMRQAGVELFTDSTELGVVGFWEVLKSIPFFCRLLKETVRRAEQERPDVAVLIDYPGYNLRLAQRLHRLGIRVVWYISPQVWAWKKGRIPKLAACVDRMLCIFPFEPAVYDGSGLDSRFVGHPLLEILAPWRERVCTRDEKQVVLLPGSRSSEIQRMLPVFLQSAAQMHALRPDLHFAMPLARQSSLAQVQAMMPNLDLPDGFLNALDISVGDARDKMVSSIAGLAASGTVTVEAALLGLPVVVAYRLNWLTWQIASCLIKIPHVSIANLVTNRVVFEEFLQYRAIPENLAPATLALLPGGARRQEALEGMRACENALQGGAGQGGVSKEVARQTLEVARHE
ncbi:MAG: lipid-A-disaccharide synthase [Victivallales bacterium]|nr:lipid-A-disaccharide synthase [Victivallales bacterium]